MTEDDLAAPLRHKSIDPEWAASVLQHARMDQDFATGELIEPRLLRGGVPGASYAMVRGGVGWHSDQHYPRWSYIAVLKADGARLHSGKHSPLELKEAMLVEFELWTDHMLDQHDDELMVWVPLDVEHRLDLDEAEMLIRDRVEQGIASDLHIGTVFERGSHSLVVRPDRIAFVEGGVGVVFEMTETALFGREHSINGRQVFDGRTRHYGGDEGAFDEAWALADGVVAANNQDIAADTSDFPQWLQHHLVVIREKARKRQAAIDSEYPLIKP